MGRHSLPVFCFGSLLSMIGTIVRHELGGGFAIDTLIIATGLADDPPGALLDCRMPPDEPQAPLGATVPATS